jgi:hypothetical protein
MVLFRRLAGALLLLLPLPLLHLRDPRLEEAAGLSIASRAVIEFLYADDDTFLGAKTSMPYACRMLLLLLLLPL